MEAASPLLQDGRRARLLKAAWQLENGTVGKELQAYPENIEVARSQHIQVLQFNKYYYFSLLCLVILTFVEVPTWCHEGSAAKDIWTWYPGTEWCSVQGGSGDLFLSGIWYLPPGYAFIVEVVVEFIIMRKFALDYLFERRHFTPIGVTYNSMNVVLWGCIFAVVGIIDTTLFTLYRVPIRMTFISRTGLIFLLPGVQSLFTSIFNRKMMTEFMSISVFLWGTMLFFAWIAVTLFGHLEEISYLTEAGEPVYVNKDLESLSGAFYTMFVAAVSGDFVDCFLPTFVTYRSAGLMWFAFLVLAKILFESLTLDTLVSAYMSGAEKAREQGTELNAKGTLTSFQTLSSISGGGATSMPKDVFLDFVDVLGKSPRMHPLPRRCAEIMFDSVADSTGSITAAGFCDVCGLLVSRLSVARLRSSLNLEQYSWGQGLCNAVWEPKETPAVDVFMNRVLLVNLVLVLVESSYNLNDWGDAPWWTDYLELIFSFVYLGEVAVKLSAKSWGLYWSSIANRFDFGTTWLLLFSSLLPYLPTDIIQFDLAHYAGILRLLRLLRVVKQLKSLTAVQFLLFTVSKMVGSARDILLMLGTVVFFFTNLSVNLFGGVLYKGNEALEGSEYEENSFFVFNFNDMFMAFSLWFSQLLCEYVPVNADALQRASDYGDVAWLIFPAFYFLSVAIMFEILLSFTVEAYVKLREEAEFEETEEEEEEHNAHSHDVENHEHDPSSNHPAVHGLEGHHHHKEPFSVGEFLDGIQEKFEERGQLVHYAIKDQPGFPSLLKEAYEEVLHKHAGKKDPEVGHGHMQICKAAWQLENAICQTRWSKYPVDVAAARQSHFQLLRANKHFNTAMICLVVLSFWEVPAWCHAGSSLDKWSWVPGSEWCKAPAQPGQGGHDEEVNFFLSGMWYLPPALALVGELVIECVILRKFILEHFLETVHFAPLGTQYYNHRHVLMGLCFSVGSILDTLFFTYAKLPMRLNWFFRTGLLFLLPGVQRIFSKIFNRRMMGEFAGVAVFFICAVIFFAWVAVTIFKDLTDVVVIGGEEVKASKGFDTFGSAIYTMFVAGIGEGFVDSFLPSFTLYRSSGILWLVFTCVAQVLLLNLVIDAFVASYLEGSEEDMDASAEAQAESTYDAYLTLKGPHGLPVERFLEFVEDLGQSPRMTLIDRDSAALIYREFGEVTKERFLDACSVVQTAVWVAPKDSCVKGRAPELWNSPNFVWLRQQVLEPRELPAFELAMNKVLMANFLLILAQSAYHLNGWGHTPSWMHVLDMLFCFAYVLEVLVKLSVKSFGEYWSLGPNQFDFFTTWLLLLTTMLPFLPIDFVQADLKQYANILRLLRLVRVFKQLRQFPRVQFMVQVVSRMVSGAGDILQLLGVMLFFFSILSVNLFGGVLYQGRPELKGTDYAKKHWFVFNFNDMAMALGTWFTQLLSEFVPEMAKALQRCTGPGAWGDVAWYIFPCFYIVGVAIIFEIAKAFTIEYYMAIKEEAEAEEEEEEHEEDLKVRRKEGEAQRALLGAVQKKLEAEGDALFYSIRDDSWSSQHELKVAFLHELHGEHSAHKHADHGHSEQPSH